jgi:hypothetical protein
MSRFPVKSQPGKNRIKPCSARARRKLFSVDDKERASGRSVSVTADRPRANFLGAQGFDALASKEGCACLRVKLSESASS